MDTESVLVVDDTRPFWAFSRDLLQEQHHNEVVVIGAAGAIAKAHGLNLGPLISEAKAAQEAIEAKGCPDARGDPRPRAPLRPLKRS